MVERTMFTAILYQFLSAPRPVKRIISVAYDVVAILGSFYLAYVLRLGSLNINVDTPLIICALITTAVSVLAFVRMGLYRAILRYMTQQAMVTICTGILISSVANQKL